MNIKIITLLSLHVFVLHSMERSPKSHDEFNRQYFLVKEEISRNNIEESEKSYRNMLNETEKVHRPHVGKVALLERALTFIHGFFADDNLVRAVSDHSNESVKRALKEIRNVSNNDPENSIIWHIEKQSSAQQAQPIETVIFSVNIDSDLYTETPIKDLIEATKATPSGYCTTETDVFYSFHTQGRNYGTPFYNPEDLVIICSKSPYPDYNR